MSDPKREIVSADQITATSCNSIGPGGSKIGVLVMMVNDGQASGAIHITAEHARRLAEVILRSAEEADSGDPRNTIGEVGRGAN